MAGAKYYSLKEIHRKKDLDGRKPSMFLISTNRSAGKTTAVLSDFLKHFRKDGTEFSLIYRNRYELKAAHAVFADVLQREYKGCEIISKPFADGLFYRLYFNDGEKEIECGFAVGLFAIDKMKKYSPMFLNVRRALFDEYQVEDGKYLSNEPTKLVSLIVSMSRGGGAQSRNIDLYLLSNNVSILNPYYIKLGIVERLKSDTRFLRGHGWILEQGFNIDASNAVSENNIVRAFSENDKSYLNYISKSAYMYDMQAFIRKPSGRSRYLFTLEYDDSILGVREFFETGEIHVNEKPETTSPYVFTFKAKNHNQNTMMLTRCSFIWRNIRDAYNGAYLTFSNGEVKNIIFELLGIDMYG